MTPAVKMSLKYMPYTCPTLDKMAKQYAFYFEEDQDKKEFLEFIEEIKKEITCPMRTALEQACLRILKLEEQLKNES